MLLLFTLLKPIFPVLIKLLSRKKVPQTTGNIRLKGLISKVEVVRDQWGIPHIYAHNIHDLLFAQGFIHAQDRLWQMDFQRRVVSGRLAEIFGKEVIQVDRWMRTLGFRRAAEKDAGKLDTPMRLDQEAYSEGVNAFIAQGKLPVEFSLLRYSPEPWSPADILSWNKMMSWNLSTNWVSEIIRAALIDHLGEAQAEELEPGYLDNWPSIVPTAGAYSLELNSQAHFFTGPSLRDGIGSNCWVLAGSRTVTGAPLLANDMHIVMSLPCIWYENHLVCSDYNIVGITAPGVPNIIAGHNGHVAWGFTAGLSDVQDLFIENIRQTSNRTSARIPARTVQYEYRGEWHDACVVKEIINVKGGKTATEEVITTRHGPIINWLAPALPGEKPVALRWVGFEPDSTSKAMYYMLRAKNCNELHEALLHWTTPDINVVSADMEGNIAYTLAGKIPIREKGSGRVPVPGWTGEYEWSGYIPFEDLPHLYNPPKGYIVTANNRVTDEGYPYYLGQEYCSGDRAQRITEMICAKERIDISYVKQMQKDLLSPTAKVFINYFKNHFNDEAEITPEIKLLKEWDGVLDSRSREAALYQVFIRCVLSLLLSNKLGYLTPHYMGKGTMPLLAEHSMFCWRSLEWLQKELSRDDSPWFDIGNGESKKELIRSALYKAVDYLKTTLGLSMESWSWGKLHNLTFIHPLGHVKAMGKALNRGPYPLGGDGTTIWASYSNMHDLDSSIIIGPPYRFIADLSHLDKSLGVLVPGQSGNPSSPHYDDQIESWFKGEYHSILYLKKDVNKYTEAKLRLMPV